MRPLKIVIVILNLFLLLIGNTTAIELYQIDNDTLYVSPLKDTIVFGDLNSKKEYNKRIKFQTDIDYKDYKVDSIYGGKKADLDLKSNKIGLMFKTVIRNTYNEKGVNFAGHYCFVEWGCGSPCQYSVIIDVVTGKIYDGISASLGYEYKIDSKMITINPTDSSGYYDECAYCQPIIYIFNEKLKAFTEK
jgi:hypothetical protein